MAVLGAIGGGLAGLAFFTFMGGAITVARFRGAGLSGTKSVALVPKSDLLAVGGQVLLLPTLIGLAAVVIIVALAGWSLWRRVALAVLVVVGCSIAIREMIRHWPSSHWGASEKEAAAALLVVAVVGALAVDRMAGKVPRDGSRARTAMLMFLVVALTTAIASYGMGYAYPSVHPMAILFADGRSGLCGFYVGETDTRVWIGQTAPRSANHGNRARGRIIEVPANHGNRAKGKIIEVPRSAVRAEAIGDSLPPKTAWITALNLLGSLEGKKQLTDCGSTVPSVAHTQRDSR